MLIGRLPILLLCVIRTYETAVPSLFDLDASTQDTMLKVLEPSISSLDSPLSRMTLETGSMEPSKPSLSFFEISKQMESLIETILECDSEVVAEIIEEGLIQIIDSGACLQDVAPTIGSLPIEAKELVLAAIEQGAYTLLKLLQKAYIWSDEHQYHWFMALSYDSPWYDKEMWESPKPVPLDWEKNIWAVYMADNVALMKTLRESVLQRGALNKLDEELPRLCIEYDSVRIFESAGLKPSQLEESFGLLVENGAVKLLQLYQSHAEIEHLHLEKFPFPAKLPVDIEGFKFLLKNGYDSLSMQSLIKEFCIRGRLDLLKHLQELDPILVPSMEMLEYAAAKNFRSILDWSRQFQKHNFSYFSICSKLIAHGHFDTLYWWIDLNGITVTSEAIEIIVSFDAFEVLKWVEKRHPGRWDFQRAINSAALYRNLPILEWVYEKFKLLPTLITPQIVTGEILDWIKSKSCTLEDPQLALRLNGNDLSYKHLVLFGSSNFELLQWVFKNAPLPVFDTQKEELSKTIKSMEMMVWFHSSLGVFPSDMNWAYKTGDLEAIRWAAENCGAYPTNQDTNLAASKGHLDVIIWIHEYVYPKNLSCLNVDTLKAAINYGNLEIADYLISNFFPEAEIEVSIDYSTCADKRLAALKWAHERSFNIIKLDSLIEKAAEQGDIQTLEWISANFPTFKPALIWMWGDLLRNDLYKPYKWLLEKYPETRSPHQLINNVQEAYVNGSLEILKVLHEKYPLLLRSISGDRATIKNYHAHQWLIANGYLVKSD